MSDQKQINSTHKTCVNFILIKVDLFLMLETFRFFLCFFDTYFVFVFLQVFFFFGLLFSYVANDLWDFGARVLHCNTRENSLFSHFHFLINTYRIHVLRVSVIFPLSIFSVVENFCRVYWRYTMKLFSSLYYSRVEFPLFIVFFVSHPSYLLLPSGFFAHRLQTFAFCIPCAQVPSMAFFRGENRISVCTK